MMYVGTRFEQKAQKWQFSVLLIQKLTSGRRPFRSEATFKSSLWIEPVWKTGLSRKTFVNKAPFPSRVFKTAKSSRPGRPARLTRRHFYSSESMIQSRDLSSQSHVTFIFFFLMCIEEFIRSLCSLLLSEEKKNKNSSASVELEGLFLWRFYSHLVFPSDARLREIPKPAQKYADGDTDAYS